MLKDHDCFRLKRPLPDGSVPVGTVGVVLIAYANGDCEVEFPASDGTNLGKEFTYTLSADYLEPMPESL